MKPVRQMIKPLTKSEQQLVSTAIQNDDDVTIASLIHKGRLEVDNKVLLEDGQSLLLLHEASASGANRVVKLLIEEGADVNKGQWGGWKPLMRACMGKHPTTVKLLLSSGADVNARSGSDGEGDRNITALMLAAQIGSLELVKILLAAGADVKALTKRGRSAINCAVTEKDCLDLVKFLVEAGCPVLGNCLVNPVFRGELELVRYLIKAGADVNVESEINDAPVVDGSSLLNLAICESQPNPFTGLYDEQKRRNLIEIIRELIKAGIDKNQISLNRSPLSLAAYVGDLEIVKLLLEGGADPAGVCVSPLSRLTTKSTSPQYFCTALHEAVAKGDVQIVLALLAAGADASRGDHEGLTALDIAKQKSHADIVEILKNAGASGR